MNEIVIQRYFLSKSPMVRSGVKRRAEEIDTIHISKRDKINNSVLYDRMDYERLKYNENVNPKSVHYIIGREGEILNIIPENEEAYITNTSKDINMIGIELAKIANSKEEERQNEFLNNLITYLKRKYDIKKIIQENSN